MRRLLLLLGIFFLAGAAEAQTREVVKATASVTTGAPFAWFEANGNCVTWQFEADNTGANTDAKGSLYICTSLKNTNTCGPLNWVDTDADGLADTNVVDNVTAGLRGTAGCFYGSGAIYLQFDTAPASGDVAEFSISGAKKVD